MSNLTVALRGLYEHTAAQQETTWEGLIGWLRTCSAGVEPVKEQIPLFAPARFQGGIQKSHVSEVSLALLDYDGTTHEQFCQVVERARRYRGFAYTTHSHYLKEGLPCRFRIALELDQPCPPSQWDRLWHGIAVELGQFGTKAPDTKSKDPGRFYFLPCQNPQGPPVWFDSWEGPALVTQQAILLAPQDYQILDQLDGTELLSNFDLHQLGTKLRNSKASSLQTIGRQLANAMRGIEFCLEGDRSNQCWKMAGEIAKAFPRASPEHIAEGFRASLELQQEPTVEQFANQIKRQQRHYLTQELERAALKRKVEPPKPLEQHEEPAQLRPIVNDIPLMVHCKRQYWLRDLFGRDYCHSYNQADIESGIQLHWGPYAQQGLLPLYSDANDLYSLRKLIALYAQPVKGVRATYQATSNTFDLDSQTLTLAPALKSEIAPLYNQQVQTWLELLAGRAYPDMAAWICALQKLDMPAPALYLWGPGGVGKTLLAHGLAKIWKKPLTAFGDVIAAFNNRLVENPLVLADEGFPPETRFTWLRSFLTTNERHINEKYQAPYVLEGHVRMIVTANNRAAFEIGRQKGFTWEDIKAISQRVMQIEVKDESRQYLESLGSVRHWVDENVIAQHALWLQQQAGATSITGRWAVTAQHSDPLGFGARLTEQAYDWFIQWIAAYLDNPRLIEIRYKTNPNWYLRTFKSQILINAMCIEYFDKADRRTPHALKSAIAYFTGSDKRFQMRVRGNSQKKIDYWILDINRITEAVKDVISTESLVQTVSIDTETRIDSVSDHTQPYAKVIDIRPGITVGH